MHPVWIILRFLWELIWSGLAIAPADGGFPAEGGLCRRVRSWRSGAPAFFADRMHVRPRLAWFGRPPESYCVAPVTRFGDGTRRLDRVGPSPASRFPLTCRYSSVPQSPLLRGG